MTIDLLSHTQYQTKTNYVKTYEFFWVTYFSIIGMVENCTQMQTAVNQSQHFGKPL